MVRTCSIVSALIAAILAAACGSSSPSTPTDTSTPVAISESFSGTIGVNGAFVQTFVAGKAGDVTAQLVALSPDDSVAVGLALGIWNGAGCSLVITNESAKLSTLIVGKASAPGQLCVRVADNGGLARPTDFQVVVSHF